MPVKKVIIDRADRIYQMPPGLLDFIRSDKKKYSIKKSELIDLATFNWVIQNYSQKLEFEDLQPASETQLNKLKEEISAWFQKTHGTKINPDKEIFIGGSIRELVHLLTLSYINYGDLAFVPEPAIPLYRQMIIAAGGEPIAYYLSASENWSPRQDRLKTRLGKVAKLMFLNSPNNPTGAIISGREIEELILIASKENILIINDAAYQSHSEQIVPSIIINHASKKNCIEFYSFSYQFGLPACPYGFAIGSREVIRTMETASKMHTVKIPSYLIEFAIDSIRHFPSDDLRQTLQTIKQSGNQCDNLLENLEFELASINSLPFKWGKISLRKNSLSLARKLFRKHRILTVPGTGFGELGQGYLRFSLTAKSDSYKSAIERLKKTKLLEEDDE